MKRVLLAVLFSVFLPVAMYAHDVDFSNCGGTLSSELVGSNTVLSLSNSELIAVDGLNGMGMETGKLGSISFTTGALISGNLQAGAIFGSGGSFVIKGDGKDGTPKGIIFNGSFSGDVTWKLLTLANGTHEYLLWGNVSGTWYNGQTVFGATVQLTINTGTGYFNGTAGLGHAGGWTDISANSVPEPGTLALLGLGTGMMGLGGALRRKRKA